MKSSIVSIVIAYIIGIIIGLYNITCIVLFLFTLICFFIYVVPKFKKIKKIIKANQKGIILFLVFIFIGVLHIKFYNYNWEIVSNSLQQNSIKAEIINIEKETEYQKTFKIKVLNKKNKNKIVLLKVNKTNNLYYEMQISSKIIFDGEPQTIAIQRNFGGFDYKEYLKSKNIYGIYKLKEGRIYSNNNISISTLKNIIVKNAYKSMKKEDADICLALSIGYKTGISDDIKEEFNKSNLSHLLAISGLHISYLMAVLNIILKPLKSKYKSFLIIIILVFFEQLAGNTPSVNRVCYTLILSIFAVFVHRKADVYNNLSISAALILLKNPHSITDLSFIFSYLGTIGIIITYPKMKNKIEIFLVEKKIMIYLSSIKNIYIFFILNKIFKYVTESIVICISANIFLLPILIYKFNYLSLLFIFSNIVVIPIFTICIILSFILIISNFFTVKNINFISTMFSIFIKKGIFLIHVISNLSIFNITFCTPSIFNIIVYYVIIIFNINLQINKIVSNKISSLMKKNNIKKIAVICIIFVICIVSIIYILPENNLKMYFVDVGQGDCTLIVTPKSKKILIDGGGSESKDFDIGKSVLKPYLLDRKIKKIDYIIISHFDTDHVGGILTILEELKVETVIISKQAENSENFIKFKELVNKKKIKVKIVNKGDRINIENDLYIDILWPNNENLIKENILNNNSIVCKLYYINVSVLFTGDIEKIAEQEILQEYKDNLNVLNSTILKVAHHGSKTSSEQEIIQNINPKIALIGVGENNKFGHPNENVLNRLKKIRM